MILNRRMSDSNALSFTDKIAIVTGSTRGIGRAIADLISELGGHVIYTGTASSNSIGDQVGKEYWQLDASDKQSVTQFADRIEKLNRLDILVNNAGINRNDSVDEMKDEDWDIVMEVNLTTPMKLMRSATRVMKKQSSGRILNISSLFGNIARRHRNSYTTTKTGLVGLTRSAGLELAQYGILVNALCPGFILTDMTRKMLTDEQRAELANLVPLGRMGSEADMAKVAAFMVSDWNTYMTTQTLVSDGGISMSPGFG